MTAEPGADAAYEWRIVTLLTLGFGLVGLDRWVISALFPAMARDLHLNYQELGVLIGALGIAWGLFSIIGGGIAPVIAGAVAQHFGIQRTLTMALVGLAVGIVVCLFLRETAPRLVARRQVAASDTAARL